MKTRKIVTAALLAALVCVATCIIKIPIPFKGYFNLGDSIIFVCAFMLSPLFGALAAGIGSAFADVFLGYISYAPATFIIKAIMALLAHFGFKFFGKSIISKVFAGILTEAFMVLGYFIYEGFLYGFGPSLVNIPANALQGVVGILAGISLVKILEKSKINI